LRPASRTGAAQLRRCRVHPDDRRHAHAIRERLDRFRPHVHMRRQPRWSSCSSWNRSPSASPSGETAIVTALRQRADVVWQAVVDEEVAASRDGALTFARSEVRRTSAATLVCLDAEVREVRSKMKVLLSESDLAKHPTFPLVGNGIVTGDCAARRRAGALSRSGNRDRR
jgi:hypothetical protein